MLFLVINFFGNCTLHSYTIKNISNHDVIDLRIGLSHLDQNDMHNYSRLAIGDSVSHAFCEGGISFLVSYKDSENVMHEFELGYLDAYATRNLFTINDETHRESIEHAGIHLFDNSDFSGEFVSE